MGIFIVAFGAMFLGIILILLLKKTSPPLPQETIKFENPDDQPEFMLDREVFKETCLDFLKKFNLEYEHSIWATEGELEISMRDETPVVGGLYLGLAIFDPPDNLVNLHKVTGFLETVKGEEASKGIIITTGYFSESARRAAEEHPVELVNIVSFIDYLKKLDLYKE